MLQHTGTRVCAISHRVCSDLELRHPRCLCDIKVQCKEVQKHNKFISVIMLLIE